jgi:ABC-type nitrate/sulfonate/bicarbonate transport system substrate-binding protein
MTDPTQIAAKLSKAQQWRNEHDARLAEIGARAGFVDAPDAASLIVRFYAAIQDRYSEDRDDPVLGPIIQRATERYGDLRRHDFTFANRVAMTEAVRAILAEKEGGQSVRSVLMEGRE